MKSSFPRVFAKCLALAAGLALLGASCRAPVDPILQDSSVRDSEVVTYENLYDREADWPYRIQLTTDWKPEGWVGRFGFGVGVLVRVERSGALRVDFGHLGKFVVPARETNVLEEANRIRTGAVTKSRANFVVAVGTRLLDPDADPPRPVSKSRSEGARAFLLVFADPGSPDLRAIARDLDPQLESEGVLAVLVPQGGHRDGGVLNACRAAGWTAPILFDRFAVPLTESVLGDAPTSTHIMLVTPEGRLILSRAWTEGALDDVLLQIDLPFVSIS